MEIAATPDNEQHRLAALYEYQILDTDAEQGFDDLVKLAADICETPIALISLVDPNRQWFKAKVGIDAKETSRDIAFCSHAILQKDIFEVEDTFLDKRFIANPLVLDDPNIRFYAGAQLVTPEGYKLGTLCAISDKPKRLTDKQREALRTLSNEVIARLELKKNYRQLQQSQTNLEQKNQLLAAINQAQQLYIADTPTQKLFSEMLTALLSLTQSEYGFIGQVRYNENGKPFLKTRAISNIAWNAETQAFFAENAPNGLEFFNLKTLFGNVLVNKKPVLANNAPADERAGGVPDGHPPLNSFAGLPFFSGEHFVGMVGIANRESGYDETLVDYLQPFLSTCAQLIAAYSLKESTS